MDTSGNRYEPLRPREPSPQVKFPVHEWWDARGRICWVDYRDGVMRSEPIVDGDVEVVWPRRTTKALRPLPGRADLDGADRRARRLCLFLASLVGFVSSHSADDGLAVLDPALHRVEGVDPIAVEIAPGPGGEGG